jgi:FKBP-type peptidyl-prolyl cis-trans isomerase
LWTALASASLAEEPLEDDHDRMLYTLGAALGRQLTGLSLSEEDMRKVQAGIRDQVLEDSLRIDPNDYMDAVRVFHQEQAELAARREREASAAYLAEAAARPGVRGFPSGLLYEELEAGQGNAPAANSVVRVHYHGTLRDGRVFDSSVDRGDPIDFPLDRVIPCWTEALQHMREGGKSRVVCPSEIAYGKSGSPPTIPGNAVLTFEVELISIVR